MRLASIIGLCGIGVWIVGCDSGGGGGAADMSVPADLAVGPDLAVPPDLLPGPDLTPGPDLALPVVWSARSSGTTRNLHAIWGASATRLFAAGDNGTVLGSSDGKTWTPMNTGTTVTLRSLWGAGGNDVYAAGDQGTIIHYDGTAWQARTSGTRSNLNVVFGVGANDVYVAGEGTTLRRSTDSGMTWPAEPAPTNMPLTANFQTIWGTNMNVWVGGDLGNLDIHTNVFGQWEWRSRPISSMETIQGIWAADLMNFFIASNDGSIRYSFDGLIWPRQAQAPVPLRAIWGTGVTDVYAVGDAGTIRHSTQKGQWPAEGSGTTQRLDAVWGSSAADVYAVGEMGTILHRN